MGNRSATMRIELCDARVCPPLISSHLVHRPENRLPTLYEVLLELHLVKSESDPLFMKKGVVGVFGIVQTKDGVIYPDDRIEFYQPIKIDPKSIRRKKANQNMDAKQKAKAKQRQISRETQE